MGQGGYSDQRGSDDDDDDDDGGSLRITICASMTIF